MKIAHLSDLHLFSIDGVPPWRFLNKRLTGYANLRLKRGNKHRAAYVRAIAKEIRRRAVDHVVVTGDLTNLALEPEYELARALIKDELGLDPSRVTVVPGNHDVYTRGALSSRRFEKYFGPWQESDLPELAVDVGLGRFPIVKLRGPVAFIALSSAVPRLPLVAAGEIGQAQLQALARVLRHPEVTSRAVVLALHHPAVNEWSALKTHLEGLRDAPALLALLEPVARGLVLHGHLHRRIQRALPVGAGKLQQVGATSASLHHEERDRMAGFNVYEIGGDAPARVEAAVLDPATGEFSTESVPKHV
jgi:3',5'-cyclic AMP phosphodiesterase CpdA